MRTRTLRIGRSVVGLTATLAVLLALAGAPAQATEIQFDTELLSMDLSGGPFPMPLANDPNNFLGDSVEGYGFVDSQVTITLSSQRVTDPGPRSGGRRSAFVLPEGDAGVGDLKIIDPERLDGQQFFVDSFFDVFFDITVTDVDTRPGRDFAGQPDGTTIALLDNGPAAISAQYTAIFDKDAPTFGLFPPPEADPWVGYFQIEIPLGFDANGNGENDKIKFTLGSHSAGDSNRTFIILPDDTVISAFDSAGFFEGAVVDESTDPPFTLGAGSPGAPAFSGPGALTGPTTASSTLLNPIIPEPASMSLLALGLLALLRRRGSAAGK